MKILFVLENYLPNYGGVEVVFKNLCEGLAKRGHKVIVLTHHIPGTKKEETIAGVKVIRVSCLDSRYLFTFASIPKAISLAKWADVIHTTTFNGAPPAWLAAKVRCKKLVITVHETWMGKWKEYSDFPSWKASMHELLERSIFLLNYDAYACVSHATANRIKEVKPKYATKISTIHNGFDTTSWLPTTENMLQAKTMRKKLGLEKKFVIFAWGRPGTSKGFQYLISAFPQIKKKIPNAHLLLVLSGGKQYAHVVDVIEKNAPSDMKILRARPYSEVQTYARMADCLVVPSVTEGFGYNVLESASTGVPLVASNTTSIPEVIYGKHLLVKPKNPKAIADGVYSIYKKKYDTTPVKSFTWASNIAAHEKLYKKLQKQK